MTTLLDVQNVSKRFTMGGIFCADWELYKLQRTIGAVSSKWYLRISRYIVTLDTPSTLDASETLLCDASNAVVRMSFSACVLASSSVNNIDCTLGLLRLRS